MLPAVSRVALVTTTLLWLFLLPLCAVDVPTSGPNADPTYQQLRSLGLGSDAVGVSNFDLKRDAATFHLRSGTVCFVPPVNGKVTGAVFVGDGNFILDPVLESERNSLKLLTKESEFSESFSQAVFRFTDATYDDIKKAGPFLEAVMLAFSKIRKAPPATSSRTISKPAYWKMS
jgi:hypothetical protein